MSKSKIFDMVVCALFGAVCCICSVIAIPTGAVPFSLGILGVIFTGVVLGPVKGLISVTVYLLLGLFLPLFSNGQNGFSAYPGPTGGYILAYPILVVVVGVFGNIKINNKVIEMVASTLSCAFGIIICYYIGTLQYMAYTHFDLWISLVNCVFPFILFDAIKCVIAGVAGPLLKTALNKAGFLK